MPTFWKIPFFQIWNPNSGSTRQGWRSIGVEGRSCYGVTVSGSWLIVSIRVFDGQGQLWAYDGSGWWLIEAGTLRIWPVSLAGAGGFDLLGFRDASTTYDLYRLVHRDPASPAWRSRGSYRTSLLHADHPDETKIWRSISASFASPEQRGNSASTDFVDLTIQYSVDGGETWIDAATNSVGGTVGQVYELGGALSGTLPLSRYLQVEVEWASVSDWTPTLTALAIGYERIGEENRRRRWQFTVSARDRQIERDGGAHLRTGPEIVTDLWTAWETASPVPFRDVDYDTDPTERRVQVVSLVESVLAPANTAAVGISQIQVILVET